DLDSIVMKCLEKDRARRYETANGLARDIQRHLDNEPVLARAPSRLYEFQKTVQRHKVGFAATAAVIAALAGGALVSSVEAVRARRAEGEQSRLLEREQQARRKADAQERIARQRAYAADMNLAQQALTANDVARGKDLLDHQRPEPGQPDLRGWEWRYLWQFCQSDALYELCRQSNAISSLAVSPDGKWVAIGESRQGGLSVWDLRTRREIARLRAGEGEVATAFSPRHPFLAFSTATAVGPTNWHCTIRLWDAETRQQFGKEFPLTCWCRRIDFAADGQTLFAFTTDDRLTRWRMPDGEKLGTFSAPLQQGLTPPLAAVVTPDGSLAVHAAPDGWVRALDLVTGKERWAAKAADEFVEALAVLSDGRTIASGGSSAVSTIRLWDAASGKEIGQNLTQSGWISALVFCPDGKKLASAGQNIRLWDVNGQGQVRPLGRPLHGHQDAIWSIALVPDQSLLVSGCQDGSVHVWDTAITRQQRRRVTLPAALSAWRFASDSQSILALDQHGQVAKWQGTLFQDRRPLFEIGTNILQANFSADGRWLAVAPTNGSIQVWDVSRGTLLGQCASSTKRMPFNSPGLLFLGQRKKLLILDHVDTVHEWDLTTQQETGSWRSHENTANAMTVAVSPDEITCLTLGRSGKRCPTSLRNMTTEQERNQDLDLSDVEDSAFSPDGKFFAAASSAGGAKVWETATLRQTAALAFLESTFSVCFSPDGRRVLTGGGSEKAVKLWDLESGQELLTLDGESTFFWPIAFSPDGNTLGSMNYKGVLHLWHAPSWGEIGLAERQQQGASKP
ncbi:MAG: hypothetical protein NT154_02475, partial [Verrucomicrobia bacterium]|nr:hypothetical protein [Verrucomicrobiota bacterium]